jgi:membrane protein implicated in regulation of membrane protease activity
MDLDPTLLTWIFFAGGLLLMLLETLVPGGVAFFLGTGGIIVAGLRVVGLLADPLTATIAWIFLSTGLTVALRPIALRYVGGESSVGITDEDAEAIGETVTVVEPAGEEKTGRIRFRGSEWDARTIDGRLPKGAEAKILYRDNLTWIIEPTDQAALDAEFAEMLGEDPDAADTDSRTAGRNEPSDDRSNDRRDDQRDESSGGLGYDPSARQQN